ncbi:alanine racemase [Pseudobacteriovorax antillogorgiicola]|uniref:Alanine racemase n=1 Tax=Pseudobacteriovorax antillogorgiicola TaxID=1513793 RepID=A0A1Y6CJD4_9BACT|nr:alanine racemase [Pseudobacteriovorax antillogorgiicola]TCS46686.1 alanine racemase [Pseudobacteriovorax antillogorgiicola]SMF66735.1 alanine racemase [Pseudobacteriovorax antillogorgiicola]
MRCWIELSRKALIENYRIFERVSSPSELMPVIKSNAYGHGLKEVYAALCSVVAPTWLGVNYVEEAEELRSFGYQGSILVVGPVPQSLYEQAARARADIFIGDLFSLETWLQLPLKPKIHIKIDTGMSRQGFEPEMLPKILETLKPFKSDIVGLASHFANVEDVVELSYAHKQLERFEQGRKALDTAGLHIKTHIASSASTLLLEQAHFNITRVGISMFGLWPSQATRLSYLQTHDKLENLKPVLSWLTEVALTKTVREGDCIGYGCTYKAMKDMTIAVLPVGYYEGYPRIASGRGSYVLIKGKRCPIVGRICMNMMMVDISHLSKVQTGDRVTLIGSDGSETIDAETLGAWAETIHYEVLTCLNPRIPRKVLDD